MLQNRLSWAVMPALNIKSVLLGQLTQIDHFMIPASMYDHKMYWTWVIVY